MKKSIICISIIFCMMLSLATTALAADIKYPVEGGYIYFDPDTGTITSCDRSVTSADIPAEIEGTPVTTIGTRAFYERYSLTSVTIPNSVTFIADCAFACCDSLTSVTIPNSVKTLFPGAFAECRSLTSVTIPDSVQHIYWGAFYNCDSLTSVTIPESVIFIGSGTFQRCDSLTSVTILNPSCEIDQSDYIYVISFHRDNGESLSSVCTLGKPGITTIYGYAGSTAQEFAETASYWSGELAGFDFVALDGEHVCTYDSTVTPPTCTEDGYTTYTCSKCGDTYVSDYVDALGHDIATRIENETAATCKNEGHYDIVTYCAVCGEELARETKTTDKLAHTYAAAVTSPTCTEDGYTTYTCSECGDTYVADYVDALGHDIATRIENETAATCKNEGHYDIVTYCAVCGEELARETKTTDKLAHTYAAAVTYPTCTKGGYTTYTCSECGDTYVADYVDALGHDIATCIENETAATCKSEGHYDLVTYCAVCGEVLNRETKTTDKLAHTYAANPDEAYLASGATAEAAATYYYSCSLCGAKDEAHTFSYGEPIGNRQDLDGKNLAKDAYYAEDYTGTYDGKAHGITVKAGADAKSVKYGVSEGTYDLKSSPTYTDAGTYTVYFKIEYKNNPAIIGSRNIVIEKKDISDASVRLKNSLRYTGAVQTQDIKTVKIKNLTVPDSDYTVTGNTARNAGNYMMILTVNENSTNFTGSIEIPWSISSSEAKDRMSSDGKNLRICDYYAEGYTGTYDGNAHGITLIAGSNMTAIAYGTEEGVFDLTSSPKFTEPGTYIVYYRIDYLHYTTVYGSRIVVIEK